MILLLACTPPDVADSPSPVESAVYDSMLDTGDSAITGETGDSAPEPEPLLLSFSPATYNFGTHMVGCGTFIDVDGTLSGVEGEVHITRLELLPQTTNWHASVFGALPAEDAPWRVYAGGLGELFKIHWHPQGVGISDARVEIDVRHPADLTVQTFVWEVQGIGAEGEEGYDCDG